MKKITIIIMAMIAMTAFQNSNAQSNKSERNIGIKTDIIKVYGNCGMDKKRIETSAYKVNGVKSAVWNEDTQMLTLQYNVSGKNIADDVQKKIASVGNDTEKYRADDMVYQNLPECCHYPRKKS